MRTLTVISGPAAGTSMPVDEVIVVGREDADLTIPDPELSRRHTEIRAADGGVVIQDLGSTNGTFVDGRRIDEPVTLSSNGTIRIGSSEIAVDLGRERAGGDTLVTEDAEQRAGVVPPGAKSGKTAKRRRRPPRKVLLLLLVVVALGAAAAGVAAIVLAGGSGTKTRTFDARLATLPLGEPTSVQASGVLQGTPLGRVEVIFLRQLAGNPRPGGRAVRLTGTMLVISSSGILGLSVRGTLRLTQAGGEVVLASGSASNGTGDYKGVKGSFTMTGGRPNPRSSVARFEIDGTLDY